MTIHFLCVLTLKMHLVVHEVLKFTYRFSISYKYYSITAAY